MNSFGVLQQNKRYFYPFYITLPNRDFFRKGDTAFLYSAFELYFSTVIVKEKLNWLHIFSLVSYLCNSVTVASNSTVIPIITAMYLRHILAQWRPLLEVVVKSGSIKTLPDSREERECVVFEASVICQPAWQVGQHILFVSR